MVNSWCFFFFFQAEDGIRDLIVTGVQTCALPISRGVRVRAMVRSIARAGGISSLPQVEIVAGDMARPETLAEPLRGVDRAMLISSSDAAMLDVQSSFIDAARKAGVKHVVKLSGIMPELDSP